MESKRRLARAVRAQNRDALAAAHVEGEAGQDGGATRVREPDVLEPDQGLVSAHDATIAATAARRASAPGAMETGQCSRSPPTGSSASGVRSGMRPSKPRATMAAWTRSPRS